MIDLEHRKSSLMSFSPKYMLDFDCFWKWKLRLESGEESILERALPHFVGKALAR
jgi:hypothetical protein